MKKKLTRALVFVCALLMVLPLGINAAIPYSTYTYSIDGLVLDSPDAYVPSGTGSHNFTTMGLAVDMQAPSDIEADKDGNVYITDKGNNRIVVLDDGEVLMDGTPVEIFAHPERLEKCGLDVPQCVSVVHTLKKYGINIEGECHTPTTCADAIERALKRG